MASKKEIALITRIGSLEIALNNLINLAEECDGWESFPSQALEDASEVLNEVSNY